MKKLTALLLALVMTLVLAACGGEKAQEAPDLNTVYEDFIASLDEAPMMMDVTDDVVETFYPGLSAIELKQSVLVTAAISAVAYEIAMVECADSADVETVQSIFQSRIDSQVDGGAMYPATAEAWEGAEILTSGNVVALIVAGQDQAAAAEAIGSALGL